MSFTWLVYTYGICYSRSNLLCWKCQRSQKNCFLPLRELTRLSQLQPAYLPCIDVHCWNASLDSHIYSMLLELPNILNMHTPCDVGKGIFTRWLYSYFCMQLTCTVKTASFFLLIDLYSTCRVQLGPANKKLACVFSIHIVVQCSTKHILHHLTYMHNILINKVHLQVLLTDKVYKQLFHTIVPT